MFSLPASWRRRSNSLRTTFKTELFIPCGACSKTVGEGIECVNAISGIRTAFCWKCWSNTDPHNCGACNSQVEDKHVVICDGCGIFEHVGCTCDTAARNEEAWYCTYCVSKQTQTTVTDRVSELEKVVILNGSNGESVVNQLEGQKQAALHQLTVQKKAMEEKLQKAADNCVLSQHRCKKAVSKISSRDATIVKLKLKNTLWQNLHQEATQKTLEANQKTLNIFDKKKELQELHRVLVDQMSDRNHCQDATIGKQDVTIGKLKVVVRELQRQRNVARQQTSDISDKNKGLYRVNVGLRAEHREISQTLSKVMNKRKRDVKVTGGMAMQALAQLEETAKKMRFLIKGNN